MLADAARISRSNRDHVKREILWSPGAEDPSLEIGLTSAKTRFCFADFSDDRWNNVFGVASFRSGRWWECWRAFRPSDTAVLAVSISVSDTRHSLSHFVSIQSVPIRVNARIGKMVILQMRK